MGIADVFRLALSTFDCQCYVTLRTTGTMSGVMTDTPDPATAPGGPSSGRVIGQGFRDLPNSLRWGTYVAVLLSLSLILAAVVAAVVVRRPWPQTSGELTVEGLQAEVEVVRDASGIPQIYADTTHDLMFAQGFVHAQDRFYEMDVRRHATAGRLAELFGAEALDSDLVVRTLGWRHVAEQELQLLDPSTRDALDAYAEGVNAYLADRSTSDIAFEYALLDLTGLDYRPERWTAVDSVAWLKAMAWDLRANVDDEAARTLLDAIVGPERASGLYPTYDTAAHPPTVTQGEVVDGTFDPSATDTGSRLRPPPGVAITRIRGAAARAQRVAAVADVLTTAPALLGEGEDIGSNAWVVDGSRTASGAPILANDPHLSVGLPGVWTQVGLHCREVSAQCPYDVSGFSFSGVPGVVIGHNRRIAWGFTNLGADVSDLYLERVVDDTWISDRRRRPLTMRAEVIEVRGEESMEITVRSTRHGPLVSDLVDLAATSSRVDLGDGLIGAASLAGEVAGESAGDPDSQRWDTGVALAWTALEPGTTMDALFALNRAEDFRSFRAALSGFEVPGQNVVYADVDGHIGYQATGRIPRRSAGHDGTRPVVGHRSRNDWRRPIPFRALPWAYDPPSGMVVSANQQPIDPAGYRFELGEDWARGYRSDRIAELLEAEEQVGVGTMQTVQLDDLSPWGPVLTPYLLAVEAPGGYYGDGPRLLADWDFRQGPDSAAAAFFNATWRQVLKATFDDELPVGLRPDGSPRWFDVVGRLLERPQDPWWDDVTTEDVTETRDDILAAAMRAARDELTALVSPDPGEWTWGSLHRLSLRSSTLGESGTAAIERIFNRDGWRVGGGAGLVDASAFDPRIGYDVTTAPAMRMIVALDDLDESRWINLTGVSGHAFHPNATDQTDLWARGEYLPWAFGRAAVLAAAEDTLLLSPAE